jgi:hypothetical protein
MDSFLRSVDYWQSSSSFRFRNWNWFDSAGLLNLKRSGVAILLPPARFCGTICWEIAKGLGPTCTCMVSDLASLEGSGELDSMMGFGTVVGVGVCGSSGGSSSMGKSLGTVILVFFSSSPYWPYKSTSRERKKLRKQKTEQKGVVCCVVCSV